MLSTRFFLLSFFMGIGLSPRTKIPADDSKTYTVYINYDNYSVRTDVLRDASKIHPKTDYFYYWYSDNDVKHTEGSFDGKLLHGEYKAFYKDKNLKEQGTFSYGLKTGQWITWYENGQIHDITSYKNGRENGVHKTYDQNGILLSKSKYKNGVNQVKNNSNKKPKLDSIYKTDSSPHHPLMKKNNRKKKTIPDNKTKSKSAQDTIAKPRKSSNPLKIVFSQKTDSLKKDSSSRKKYKRVKSSPPKIVK